MTDGAARQAVLDHLAGTSARREPARGSVEQTRPVPSLGPQPFTALPASVRFLKERGAPDRRLFAVTFDDERGDSWFWIVAAERGAAGAWVASGGAGGSGGAPLRHEPWVNLAAWWDDDSFYAGGRVLAAAGQVAGVRLRAADGMELEDDAVGDVVLFLGDRPPAAPLVVELYDSGGRAVARHRGPR